MKFISAFIAFVLPAIFCFGQSTNSILVMEFIKIKNDKQKESAYFYENNWKAFRNVALQKKYIKSYELLINKPDPAANFDIMLITEYADSLQLKLSEARFEQIIKTLNANGPRLLNDLRPGDFIQKVSSRQTGIISRDIKMQ